MTDNKQCLYCDNPTLRYIELGRGKNLSKIPCCERCFDEVDKLPQHKKDSMSEAAAMMR